MKALALFDLDHTLLSGDSDELWCDFLMDEGVLDRAEFEPRNADMVRRYRAASVTPQEFSDFYVGTLAGRSPEEWQGLRERFLRGVVLPLIPASARALVETHRARGERIVMTTATNRYITELTARDLRITDLIATDAELVEGRFTGRTTGVPNMREGKVVRLRQWLAEQSMPDWMLETATFYSDSSNDLPLLRAVGHAVAVDPDDGLRAEAAERGWEVLRLAR
ncbi:HAD family hydrolase [soil metagenome]